MVVIEIHRSKDGQFYFRLMGKNYKEICRSSEVYRRKATMRKSIDTYGGGWPIVDCDEMQKNNLRPKKATQPKAYLTRKTIKATRPVEPPKRRKK